MLACGCRWLAISTLLMANIASATLPKPLYVGSVTVSDFDVGIDDTGIGQLRWRTSCELGDGFFTVQRIVTNGDNMIVVASEPLQCNEEGALYECDDQQLQIGEVANYELLFTPNGYEAQVVATWSGVVTKTPAVKTLSGKPSAPIALAQEPPPDKSWVGNRARVRSWDNTGVADRVRIGLQQRGIYRITAQELADTSGWDIAMVTNAIATTDISLSCQGQPVAWLADGNEALLFYGEPTTAYYAPENVYWLEPGTGTGLAAKDATPLGSSTNEWFYDRIHVQGTNYLARQSYSTLTNAPYVTFNLLLQGKTFSHASVLPDSAPGNWSGKITVDLLSYHEVGLDNHTAEISLGTRVLTNVTWSGEQKITVTVPFTASDINAGTANLKLSNIHPVNNTNARFLLVSYEIEYARLYRAKNGTLNCTGGLDDVLNIAGFEQDNIQAWDVTDPAQPELIVTDPAYWDDTQECWSIAFADGGSDRVYQVFSSSGVLEPSLRGVVNQSWDSKTKAPKYAILVPPEGWIGGFREVLQPLAARRNRSGLRTAIIDVEAIYNQYSYGLADPAAIQAFCATAYPFGLRYVMLAGGGSLDFKHLARRIGDKRACLIPSFVSGQGFNTGEGLSVPLDAVMGDANGDGKPEIAIGRIPTAYTNEISVVIEKIIQYEVARQSYKPVILSADWDNEYTFRSATDLLIPLLVEGMHSYKTSYRYNTNDGDSVRVNSLQPALRDGASIFYFLGHTNEQHLGSGNSKMIFHTQITAANWNKPTVAIFYGCRQNRWQTITDTDIFLPYGMFQVGTGFVSGIGVPGNLMPEEGKNVALGTFRESKPRHKGRLGDMFLQALNECNGTMPYERLMGISLVGDPTLLVDSPDMVIIIR